MNAHNQINRGLSRVSQGLTQICKHTSLALALFSLGYVCTAPVHAQTQSNSAQSAQVSVAALRTVPLMKSWSAKNGELTLANDARLVVRSADFNALSSDAQILAVQLQNVTGRPWTVVKADKPKAGDVFLSLTLSNAQSKEAYRLSVDNAVHIEASAATGIFYGAQTVQQLLKHSPKRASLAKGSGLDFPDQGMRAVMIDLGRRYMEVPRILNLIQEMSQLKLNTLHLHLTDWLGFRLRSEKFPGLASEQSYSKEEMQMIESFAARHHILLIPEIDLPAHANAITTHKPSLGFECVSMRKNPWEKLDGTPAPSSWTIDITKNENNEYVKSILNEFIPWFKGPYFHLGGDEYQYDANKNQCPELVEFAKKKGLTYTGDVFIDWFNQMNKVIQAHGKKTIIWSWWGYNNEQTSILPSKDIIIEVWNPELEKMILNAGFETILSSGSEHYVVPGGKGNRPDSFGDFNTQKVYEQYDFKRSSQVKGYAMSIWSDTAIKHSDQYVLNSAYEPMLVMSERLWTGRTNRTVWDLFGRANEVVVRK